MMNMKTKHENAETGENDENGEHAKIMEQTIIMNEEHDNRQTMNNDGNADNMKMMTIYEADEHETQNMKMMRMITMKTIMTMRAC